MTLHEDMHDLMERVIRQAYLAGWQDACTPDGMKLAPERYTDWRQYGPGAQLPFGLGPARVKQPRDTRAWADYLAASEACAEGDPDEVAVCTAHMRFVPCRRPGACHITSLPSAVKTVQEYQQRLADYGESPYGSALPPDGTVL